MNQNTWSILICTYIKIYKRYHILNDPQIKPLKCKAVLSFYWFDVWNPPKCCSVMLECRQGKHFFFQNCWQVLCHSCNVVHYSQEQWYPVSETRERRLHFLLYCESWTTASNANPDGSICTLSDPRRERSRHWLTDACRAQVNKTSGNNLAVNPCFSMTFQRKPLISQPDVQVSNNSQSFLWDVVWLCITLINIWLTLHAAQLINTHIHKHINYGVMVKSFQERFNVTLIKIKTLQQKCLKLQKHS